MNNQNQPNGEMIVGIMIVSGLIALAIVFYALAVFAAIIFTAISLCAWNKPLQIGKHVVTPEEARSFVGGGVVGFFGLPLFAVFAAGMFGAQLEEAYMPHLFLGGYVLGAFGYTSWLSEQQEDTEEEPDTPYLIEQPRQAAPYYGEQSQPQQPAFRYASWNDEEIEDQR